MSTNVILLLFSLVEREVQIDGFSLNYFIDTHNEIWFRTFDLQCFHSNVNQADYNYDEDKITNLRKKSKRFINNIEKWSKDSRYGTGEEAETKKFSLTGTAPNSLTENVQVRERSYTNMYGTLTVLMHASISRKESFVSKLMLKFDEIVQNTTVKEEDLLMKCRNIFLSLEDEQKVSFMETIKTHGESLVESTVLSVAGEVLRKGKIPRTPEAASGRWWNRRLKKLITFLKWLVMPEDSPEYTHVENDYGDRCDDLAKFVLDEFSYDENFKFCLKQLMLEFRGLFVEILQEEEMKPIMHGALFGSLDIEEKMKDVWTNIKFLNGISNNKFDETIFLSLDFMNQILGFKFVMSGKTFDRHFLQKTKHLAVRKTTNNVNNGVFLSLAQTLDEDHENIQLRDEMKFLDLEEKGEHKYIATHVIGIDAANEKSRGHATFTSVHRWNYCYPACAQNKTFGDCLGVWEKNDKFGNQKVHLPKFYKECSYVEDYFEDPLAPVDCCVPIVNCFFFVCDTPCVTDSVGASMPTATYSCIYADGISYASMTSPENSPISKILSINRDKKDAEQKYENNLQMYANRGHQEFTQAQLQAAATKTQTCTKNEYLGHCILSYMILMHLRFKVAERLLTFLTILACWSNDIDVKEVQERIRKIINTTLEFLFNPLRGTLPGVGLRGDLVEMLTFNFRRILVAIVDLSKLPPEVVDGLYAMITCAEIIFRLLKETADLDYKQALLRGQLLEHHMIIFLEYSVRIFGTHFSTWSLRVLCDIGPFGLRLCFAIGYGWDNVCENNTEATHVDTLIQLKMLSRNLSYSSFSKFERLLKLKYYKRILASTADTSVDRDNYLLEQLEQKQENLSPDPFFEENEEWQVLDLETEDTLEKVIIPPPHVQLKQPNREKLARESFVNFSSFFLMFTGGRQYYPHTHNFRQPHIIVSATGRGEVVIEMIDDDSETWQFSMSWWKIRGIEITEVLDLPLNHIDKWDDNLRSSNGFKLIVIDLYVSGLFKPKSQKSSKIDPTHGLIPEATSIILEVRSNVAEVFKTRVQHELSYRGINDVLGTKCIAKFEKKKYSQRTTAKNCSKIPTIQDSSAVVPQCIWLKNYVPFGKITHKECIHPSCMDGKCAHPIGGSHSVCKTYLDSPGVCCGSDKHDLIYKLLKLNKVTRKNNQDLKATCTMEAKDLLDCFMDHMHNMNGGVPLEDLFDYILLEIDSIPLRMEFITLVSRKVIISTAFETVFLKYCKFNLPQSVPVDIDTPEEVRFFLEEMLT